MVDLFQERYRELPAFQKAKEHLEKWANDEMSTDELTTRVLMLSENGLSWDTLCQNCGALMDKNYEQYVEIQKLKEDLAHEMNKNLPQWVDGVCTRCDTPANRHGHGYCWIDM